MGQGVFITGTDTGVGKTFVAEGLLRAFRARGLRVCPMKPVETGCRTSQGKLIPGDINRLAAAAGAGEAMSLMNPYRFRLPVAPSVAADLEGRPIRIKRILSITGRLVRKYDVTLVEGAGGIMVPLNRRYLFLHLLADLGLPAIIVARPGLGTINHTLLTLAAAQERGIDIIGVILNHVSPGRRGTPEKTNPEVLERLGRVPILGRVPYAQNPRSSRSISLFQRLAGNIWTDLSAGRRRT